MCTYFTFIRFSHSLPFKLSFSLHLKKHYFHFFLFIFSFVNHSFSHSSLLLLSFPVSILIYKVSLLSNIYSAFTPYWVPTLCFAKKRTKCVSDLFKIMALTCISVLEIEPTAFKHRYPPGPFRNIETRPHSVTKFGKLVSHL